VTRVLIPFSLLTALAGVYLFVSAPQALPEGSASSGKKVSARDLLEMCAAENAVVRELYTKSIVETGLKAGLKFDERWREANVEAGPLPALFLRETAKSLAKGPTRLAARALSRLRFAYQQGQSFLGSAGRRFSADASRPLGPTFLHG
jgi:hypothetical protein